MYFNQKSILAADYLRLSREDGDKLESDSIRNQRSLINDFVKQHPEITLVDEYVDDGYSGTNFERPAFKRLIEDVKKKKINCIIVKDLESGRYGIWWDFQLARLWRYIKGLAKNNSMKYDHRCKVICLWFYFAIYMMRKM